MKIIGLTGGIASGKSTVAQHLGTLGAIIVDADVISRTLSQPGGSMYDAIMHTFGPEYRTENGQLDRKKLGACVFADPAQLAKLNAISHPLIRAEISRQIAQAREGGAPAVILDAPVLLESGMQDMVQEVWLAVLPVEEQISRVMARDGATKEAAQARIAAQWPLEEKKKYADVCIDTSGTIADTCRIVDKIWIERVQNSGNGAEKNEQEQ